MIRHHSPHPKRMLVAMEDLFTKPGGQLITLLLFAHHLVLFQHPMKAPYHLRNVNSQVLILSLTCQSWSQA